MRRSSFVATSLLCATLALVATSAIRAQQPPAQAAGPLAPEKYKDIQVLKDVPADQLDLTMRYFVAATGLNCSNCHQRDQATGEFNYAADTNTKRTARNMIKIVQTINAGDFGARINCGTCHQGLNRPAGLAPATMMTPDQLAALAARQGGPGGAGGPGRAGAAGGPPPAGGGPPGQGRPGGAGNQAPAPAVDDVLNKYIEAIGGASNVQKLQSLAITGTYVTRANQTVPFTIEEKGNKYRETDTLPGATQVFGFDGTAGWIQSGTFVTDMAPFQVQQFTRLNDLPRMLHIKDLYTNVTAGRPTTIPPATPGGTPVAVNLVQGSNGPSIERFYFDVNTGLLLRRQITTQTPLNGRLTETFDYSNYKPVAGVMLPFTIKRNNWNQLDTLTITDVKPNVAIDDGKFSKPKGQG
ncbi:MAG TPA: photosynthetic reaction center cytochrome c subunit family protein [Vicinamibacterales bacterium]|nr:photosynthetic reaction center cytochrome c subunit family protein [Vicinamibacterales bacterium]